MAINEFAFVFVLKQRVRDNKRYNGNRFASSIPKKKTCEEKRSTKVLFTLKVKPLLLCEKWTQDDNRNYFQKWSFSYVEIYVVYRFVP